MLYTLSSILYVYTLYSIYSLSDIPKSFFLHLLAIFVVLLYKWIDFNQYCRVKDDTFSNFPSSSLFFSIHAFSSIV